MEIISYSPDDTRAYAATLARELASGAVLALHGDLGAGKTCFVQGLAQELDIPDPISSPTYTLVHEYEGTWPLYHIDLYRIQSIREALEMGLDRYCMEHEGITAIEWAERVKGLLPDHTYHIFFSYGTNPDERIIRIEKTPR